MIWLINQKMVDFSNNLEILVDLLDSDDEIANLFVCFMRKFLTIWVVSGEGEMRRIWNYFCPYQQCYSLLWLNHGWL